MNTSTGLKGLAFYAIPKQLSFPLHWQINKKTTFLNKIYVKIFSTFKL